MRLPQLTPSALAPLAAVVLAAVPVPVAGCSGTQQGFAFTNDDAGPAGSGGSGNGGSGNGSTGPGGPNLGGGSLGADGGGPGGEGGTVTTTTIYAHTDSQLYSMNPQSKALTLIGSFTGLGGSSGDDSITDLAVNAAGEVYVNSETVIYKAAVPSSGTGSVPLTTVATIAVQSGQSFYALGFTPKDALGTGTGEVLIGGDGNGELWSISPSSGATKDLGNFGADPSDSSATLALSGDVVFYIDSTGAPKGLATIRSCTTSSKGSSTCDGPTDYLAGIDMTALSSAYASGTPASSLNAGMYGSSASNPDGPGIGYPEVFGLGIWGGSVYGFTHGANKTTASLLSIATSGSASGVGAVVPTSVSASSGWAGAGVTTSVTVTVANPPAPLK
jgi:hypothetical protein